MQHKHKNNSLLGQTPFRFALMGFLLFLNFLGFTQDQKRIEIVSANSLEADEVLGKRLIGNVTLLHDGTFMRCDSAYLEPDSNFFHAFGRVRINKGDSIKGFADEMVYNGNTQKGRLMRNVKILQDGATLLTDDLIYDEGNDIAYYLNGGKIIEDKAVLTSKKGYYHTVGGYFSFRDSVVLIDEDLKVFSDSLQYFPDAKKVKITGPTDIISEKDSIYCENGNFYTERKIGHFTKNAVVKSADQDLYADSIYFNSQDSIGEAYRNVRLYDKKENIWVHGEVAKQNQKTEQAIVYDKALLIQIDKEDTLFMHADTLKFLKKEDGKELYAFYHVKFFRQDLQGKCDSVNFAFSDSLLKMYGSPILWSDENQITSDTINILVYDSDIHQIRLSSNSFIASQYDSLRYNQITGKKMVGYFKENKIVRFDVFGNGESIYYAEDKDKKLIGVNEIVCSDIVIYLEENQIQRIKFIQKPNANFYPPGLKDPKTMILKGFRWNNEDRPLKKGDVFIPSN